MISRGLRFSTNEARVLLDRINKVHGGAQHDRNALETYVTVSRKHSPAEVIFAHQIKVLKLDEPVRNLRFYPGRRFEFDFAWPNMGTHLGKPITLRGGLVFEIQGDVHRIKARADADTEKFFLAVMAGWTVVPVSTRDVRSGRASVWLTTLLEQRAAL